MFQTKLIKLAILIFVCKNNADQSIDYTSNTVPDSQRDWISCGVREPSFLCDPYRLLNRAEGEEDGALKVHSRLEHLRLATTCPCSHLDQCHKANPHGYTISVVVVKSAAGFGISGTIPNMPNSPRSESARSFSEAVRLRFRQRAQCEDDALIVLSVADDIVWTSVGALIGKKLTPDIIDFAAKGAREYFSKHDYTRGLLYMIHEYSKHLLPTTAPNVPSTNADGQRANPLPVDLPTVNEEGSQVGWSPGPELGNSVHLEDEILWPWWNFWPWTKFPSRWASSADKQWLRVALLIVFLLIVFLPLTVFAFLLYKLIKFLVERFTQRRDGYSIGKFRHSN